jgi:hypothetical protein
MKLLEVGAGKTYSTIQDAINAIPAILDDWYKILIYDGTYSGFIINGKTTAYLTKYILVTKNVGSVVIINDDIYIQSKYVYVEKLELDNSIVHFGLDSDYSIIRNCEFYNNTDFAVIFDNDSANAELKSCLLYDGFYGIKNLGGSGNHIRNNVIRGLSGTAIHNETINQAFIINNTIDNNNVGIMFLGNQDIRIRNNNVTNNVIGIMKGDELVDTSIKSNNNVWNNGTNYIDTSVGENGFSFDPKYTNYIGNDFTLQSNSQCIDNGTYINAPDTDYNGISRPRLNGFDIGAFEYRMANVAPVITIISNDQRNDGSGKIDIIYNGIDENYDICSLNIYEYSLTGSFSGEEEAMTPALLDALHDRTDNLSFTFTGSEFDFVWDAYEDLEDGFEGNVFIRIRANDGLSNSNIASGTVYVDLKKAIINTFQIDSNTEEEDNVSINGLVDINIEITSTDLVSMKFSNNGISWSAYEPYATTKSWNLISGFGGQPFQGLKKVFIKVKDSYGNETDGTLYDSTWYKSTDASVENLTTHTMTHSISKAILDATEGDSIEVQTDETFFESFEIDKNNIKLIVADGFTPTIDMTDRTAIILDTVNDIEIEGFIFIEANDRIIEVNDCNNITFRLNVFDHEHCIRIIDSSDTWIDRNIFRDGEKGVELNGCSGTIFYNNQFIRLNSVAIELENSQSTIINNHFIDNYNCIENLSPNDDSSIVRNNIFYGNTGICISANPIWIIDHNNFWNNIKEYFGLVERWEEYQNFKADPKFVNYNEDNFYLMSDSQCINVGSFKDAPSWDFNNNYRKQDTNYDIGAFEYYPIPEYVFNIQNILESNNVKNVFIYDTTKDNVSNSWRTAIGFPEVAYLIVTEEGLYIADSSDNSLYMKFESGTDNVIDNDTALKGLFALNGIIYVSNGSNGGLISIDFINNNVLKMKINGRYQYNSTIEDRNNGSGYDYFDDQYIIYDNIGGNDVRDIDGAYINGNTYIAIATENSISIVKNLSDIINYGDSNYINKIILTNNGRLYYIDLCFEDYYISYNNLCVFYDINEDTTDKIIPNYIYNTLNEYGPKLYSLVVNDISVVEGDSKVKRNIIQYINSDHDYPYNIESNTIYVATDNGINVLYTYEDTKAYTRNEESEKWGFSKQYLLKEDYDPADSIILPNLVESNNGNYSFEDGGTQPNNWSSTGFPIYSKSGNDSFSGLCAVRVCAENSYSSDIMIPIEGNTDYLFGAAMKADQFDSKAVIRIEWYNSASEFISASLLDIGTDIYYRKYYGSIKSPILGSEYEPTNGYAKITLNGDGLDDNKKFWFDEIEFYETRVNTNINNYVLEGSIKNIDHIHAFDDLLLFVAKETNNDQLYLYDRNNFNLKMNRTTSLPARNISSLYFNKII